MAKRGEKRRRNRALIEAVVMDDLAAVRDLLRHGADVNTHDAEHHDTPLILAQSDGMRRLLLDAGAEVDARNVYGRTAFWWNPCALLLEAGADINAQDFEGYTPLMQAVFREEADQVEWLIRRGADVNAVDRGGETALSPAREEGLVPIIEMLTKAGARK